ncbi:MAG: rod shape-determining protein RodA [Legionellaceae bacterium]|nr:rod shape-determining protein RodA [Legionellaceae bacterium]|tara:strand:- start:439 stop:1575 length:1137 start_codon:yes stop_codon:yes gene_type:complete
MDFNNQLSRFLKRRPLGRQYRQFWQILHLDLPLLVSLGVLVSIGFIILYSASNQSFHMVISQFFHLMVAIGIMILVAQLPPWWLERWAPWFYGISLLLLLAVLGLGHIAKGAQRWLSIGGFRFQPSELMKLAIPMMLAWYYQQRRLPPSKRDLFISAAIILIPAVLVAKQPDLGTAIVLACAGGAILLFAGISWRLLLGLFGVILVVTPVLWHFMKTYQQQRILTFFSPERDPRGAGYHIIQSKIAIGSGGFFGKGWLHGTQAHLHFLPEHATDFIFAVSGEEFGFIGCTLLVSAFIAITMRGLWIANQAGDTFSRLLAGSLALMFFISAFINMGMVSGIMPVVGLPLPLVSYSGTSMLTLLASFGILMSIHGHRRLF